MNLKQGIESLNEQPKNKYNLKSTKEMRRPMSGSMSQEISSIYDHLSDLYGVDMEDLIYGDKGFMKSKYPQGFPDFSGDVAYSSKYWDEMEKWAKDQGVDFQDRRWERYKLDPEYFEWSFTPEIVKQTREYGQKLEPNHESLKDIYHNVFKKW